MTLAVALFASLAFAADAARAQSFAPTINLPAGVGAFEAAVGDFNGDGKPDLASANYGDPVVGGSNPGTVSVFLGNGDGTFAAQGNLPAMRTARGVIVGDFNRDGKPDLAVMNSGFTGDSTPSVSLFLGNGDGTFQPRADTPVASRAEDFVSADFNADNNPDLAVISETVLGVLLGNGDGTFRPRMDLPVGPLAIALASGDFNADAKPDLAYARQRDGGGVFVLLGNGDGTFQPAVHYATGFNPVGVAVGDFDADGKADLATANSIARNISVLPGNGDGTFRPKIDSATPSMPRSLKVADFDGDGKADVAVALEAPNAAPAVLRGKGDGSFLAPRSFPIQNGFALYLSVGDLNLDNRPDLLGATFFTGTVHVLLNRTGPRAVSGLVSDESGAPLADTAIQLTGPEISQTSVTTGADGRYLIDGLPAAAGYTATPLKSSYSFTPPSRALDLSAADATADFTAAVQRFVISGFIMNSAGARMRGVTVTLSGDASATTTTDGNGVYRFTGLPSGGDYTVTPSLPRFVFNPPDWLFLDLSANGVRNFTGSPQVFHISGKVRDPVSGAVPSGVSMTLSGSKADKSTVFGDGSYIFAQLPIGGDYTVTASQNLSGKLFTNFRLGQTSRRFSDLESNATADFDANFFRSAVGSEPRVVTTADFNRDGKTDVATANTPLTGEAGSISVLLGRGDATFQPESRITADAVPADLLAADYNGDGNPDLALATTNARDVGVLLGNGDGTFQPRVTLALNGTPRSLAPGDFNGDGKLDLAVAGIFNPDFLNVVPGFKILFNRGDGTFDLGPLVSATLTPTMVRAGDFNGDGKLDLAFGNEQTGASVRLGNGDGTFGAPLDFTDGAPWFPSHVTPAHFDADGKLDLLVRGGAATTDSLWVLLGNGNGTFRQGVRLSGGRPFVGDFDADGKPDIVTLPLSTGGVFSYFGNGDGTFRAGPDTFLNTNQWGGAAADFNGDGRSDLAYIRSAHSSLPGNLEVLLNVLSSPTVQFSSQFYNAPEAGGPVTVTVTRTGDLSAPASVAYATSNSTASDRGDYTAAVGTLRFAANEASKTFEVFITDDVLVEGTEQFHVGLGSPDGLQLGGLSTATVIIQNNDTTQPAPADNPIHRSDFFVRMHYRDFLNRDPDQAGLDHWANQIESCGADSACRQIRRINVSAAFFLSIEFQETGFLAYRMYKAAYGDINPPAVPVPVRVREFLADSQEIGRGVQVGVDDWLSKLEANKAAYASEFVTRQRFTNAYPSSLTPAEFVARLNANTGGVLSPAEAEALALALAAAGNTPAARADALRAVADNAELKRRETNRAFVLMQYFGYLRRNPDDPPDANYDGFLHWLGKLNEHNGNFVKAEMVRAFIESFEYQERFGR